MARTATDERLAVAARECATNDVATHTLEQDLDDRRGAAAQSCMLESTTTIVHDGVGDGHHDEAAAQSRMLESVTYRSSEIHPFLPSLSCKAFFCRSLVSLKLSHRPLTPTVPRNSP